MYVVQKTLIVAFFVLQISIAQETVPISLGNAGHLIVTVRVNDTTGTFILDTGAGIHVVSPRFLRRLAPQPAHAGLFTGFRHNGVRLDAELFRGGTLSIGGQTQSAPVFGVYPPLEQWGIDGLVSMKFFEERIVTIDFRRKELRFEDSNSVGEILRTAETIPLELHADRGVLLDLFVRLVIQDSVEILAEFDTGAGFEAVLVHPAFLARLGIDTVGVVPTAMSEQTGGPINKTISHQVSSLSFANAASTRQKNVAVTFKEGLIYEGLIGSGAFKERRLTIDIPHRRMLVW